jgi:hypothetical protein
MLLSTTAFFVISVLLLVLTAFACGLYLWTALFDRVVRSESTQTKPPALLAAGFLIILGIGVISLDPGSFEFSLNQRQVLSLRAGCAFVLSELLISFASSAFITRTMARR